MPLNQSSSRIKGSTSAILKTRKTSTYNLNFEQILIDNHTYSDNYDFPNDWDPSQLNNESEIFDRLKHIRQSLSPSRFSDKAFRNFGRANAQTLHKDDIIASVIPVIQGNDLIPSARNISFRNMQPFADNKICYTKFDFYNGVCLEEIYQHIYIELDLYLIPSIQ